MVINHGAERARMLTCGTIAALEMGVMRDRLACGRQHRLRVLADRPRVAWIAQPPAQPASASTAGHASQHLPRSDCVA